MCDPVILSSFDDYLARDELTPEVRAEEMGERIELMSRFPYAVMLQVGYDELDFANRWCWQQFGPAHGLCLDRDSNYRVCDLTEPHSHAGNWMWHWWLKTAYDFGFNEWYFSEQSQSDRFLRFIPQLK